MLCCLQTKKTGKAFNLHSQTTNKRTKFYPQLPFLENDSDENPFPECERCQSKTYSILNQTGNTFIMQCRFCRTETTYTQPDPEPLEDEDEDEEYEYA